jgi:hypothetical protein
MATKIFHLLTTGLSHDSLASTVQSVLAIAKGRFAAEQPLVGPAVVQVEKEYAGYQQALSRKAGSVYTPAIKQGHTQRVDMVIGFKYLIRNKLKQTVKPEVVAAAQEVKAALVNSGLWNHTSLCQRHISSFIANLIRELSDPRYREMLAALGMVEAFEELVASQQRYDALKLLRYEEQAADTTLRGVVARERLLQSLNMLLSAVALGAKTDPSTFEAAAQEIDEVVREANAVTRSGKTRRDNAAASAPPCARETEQTEAAVNGQGSTSAVGAVQHAAFTPQGNPVFGVTPETNPLAPPIGKGVSTG